MRVEDVVDGYFFFSFFADVHGIYVVRILCTMYVVRVLFLVHEHLLLSVAYVLIYIKKLISWVT